MALGSIGKYEKLDVLGHGTSGIVYLAWDKLLGRHVALKEISIPASEEGKFLEEARVLDRLRHPNIVQVNSVDRIDGHLIIDMEYVKGTNLMEYMRSNGRLSVSEALRIAVQVCDALQYAHSNHTIHRDIKPANILIGRDGAAKIADFGLAEILGSGSYAGGAGTYAYMAPEDFEEEDKSDHRSDIWALGVTLYEMLSGRRPFQAAKAKDPFSWKRAVDEDEPSPLSDLDSSVSGELEQVIRRALAKDKQDRYQSMGELRDDLSAILVRADATVAVGARVAGDTRPEFKIDASAQSVVLEPSAYSAESIVVEPSSLQFDSLRKGEALSRKLLVSIPGRGRTNGRIVSQPGWLSVTPQSFHKRKQMLCVTADTASIWEAGEYSDHLVLDLDGANVSIPLSMEVTPARRRFAQVFWWYIPLLALALLPIVVAQSTHGVSPAGVLAAGILSVMLFIIGMVADLGIVEKIIPMMLAGLSIGVLMGILRGSASSGDTRMWLAGTMLSLLVVFQFLSASKWRLWAAIMAASSICVTLFLAG